MIEPRTKAQWQEAVDAAEMLLVLDSARQYGLIAGGPKIKVERCMKILHDGRKKGITPAADGVERMVEELTKES